VAKKITSLLDAFAAAGRELSLNELARRAQLPLSTTYRLASDLVDWGGLERADGGGYRVGLRLWEIGSLAHPGADLRDLAVPFMRDLHQATHEDVQLAVMHGREAHYIEKVTGRQPAAPAGRGAVGLPLHATGAGKALLAYAPTGLLDDVIQAGLDRYTARTIIAPNLLRESLNEVRRTGVAFARDELILGAVSIGAPLIGVDGHAVAAISIVARSNGPDVRRLGPAVRTAALCASRQLRERLAERHHPAGADHRPGKSIPVRSRSVATHASGQSVIHAMVTEVDQWGETEDGGQLS
jgi:DNA-binding IclR family transcriptional regulator